MQEKFDITRFFGEVKVLDKGHVEFFDGMVIDPKIKIVNAARVSFGKQVEELSEKDMKLIDFLFKHKHFSTFRHSYFSFRLKCPLMVFRQFWKHQIACEWVENDSIGSIELPSTSWNEISYRYTEFVPEFYIPETIRMQSKSNKQGSSGVLTALINGEDPVRFFTDNCLFMYEKYKYLIDSGAAKEQSRMLLPQNIYSECVLTISLQALLYFLEQRLSDGAQFEIREYAKAIAQLILPILEPLSILQENG